MSSQHHHRGNGWQRRHVSWMIYLSIHPSHYNILLLSLQDPQSLAMLLVTQPTRHSVVQTVVRQPVELSQPRLRKAMAGQGLWCGCPLPFVLVRSMVAVFRQTESCYFLDGGTSGRCCAAVHSSSFVFRDRVNSSSAMWFCCTSLMTTGGSAKSVCSRPGQPDTVHLQCCFVGYKRSFL